jgi:hypothetical protein
MIEYLLAWQRVTLGAGSNLGMASDAPQARGRGNGDEALNIEQRLARLIELKAQRDETDREIAVLLGEAPPPRRPRASVRDMSSGNSQMVSHSKNYRRCRGDPTAEPNGS